MIHELIYMNTTFLPQCIIFRQSTYWIVIYKTEDSNFTDGMKTDECMGDVGFHQLFSCKFSVIKIFNEIIKTELRRRLDIFYE